MQLTAVDIAILPSGSIKNLAIKLSKELNFGNFHLNATDILPHITLGIGFLDQLQVPNVKNQISNIAANISPFEITVEKMDGRYLMCRKSEELYGLHKAVCDAVPFQHFENENLVGGIDFAYFAKPDEKILEGTKEFTNNYKWRNAYLNFVPHVTVAWDDNAKVDASEVRQLPLKFKVEEVFICQLGNHNTCRKKLGKFRLGEI